MIEFRLASWMGVAPGFSTSEDWFKWSLNPQCITETKIDSDLSSIPPMLKRRFSVLGKSALSSSLPLLHPDDQIPSVFASRHGDTALTLSLLESIGKDEALSPTKFSLAVHNAVSGLFSIARNDTSVVTSIAASEGLFIQAIIEAAGLLITEQRVLCVIHDAPLANLYTDYTDSFAFPYAIAIVLNKSKGRKIRLEPIYSSDLESTYKQEDTLMRNELEFVSLLAGATTFVETKVHGVTWRTSMVGD